MLSLILSASALMSHAQIFTRSSSNGSIAITPNGLQGNSSASTDTTNVGLGPSVFKNMTIGNFNTALGSYALFSNVGKSKNTAIGYRAMYYADNNSTAVDGLNTAIGVEALRGGSIPANNTGIENTAVGNASMSANTSGGRNTAIGGNSLRGNTSGGFNTALGIDAMYSNTTGGNNIAVGGKALYNNRANSRSTAIGYDAMFSANSATTAISTYNTAVGFSALRGSDTPANNTGTSNTAVGDESLKGITSGSGNSAVGRSALSINTTGQNNVAVGYLAGNTLTTGSDNIIIGVNAQPALATGSGQIQMGVDAATITSARVRVAWDITSDKRYKENIRTVPLGLDFIRKLHPVAYHRIGNPTKDIEMGLIAQELEETVVKAGAKDLGIIHKDDNGFYSVRYNDLMAPMIKAMQEQQAMIEKLQNENAQLRAENKTFESRLTSIEALFQKNGETKKSVGEER